MSGIKIGKEVRAEERVMQMLEKNLGFRPEFQYPVKRELRHWLWTLNPAVETVEELAQKVYERLFSETKDTGRGVFWDTLEDHGNKPLIGFVVSPQGEIYVLRHRYTHGLVIASVEPEMAFKNGACPPQVCSDCRAMSNLDYQTFSFEAKGNGYIEFGNDFIKRLSFRRGSREDGLGFMITQEQVDALRNFFTDNDMLDDKMETCFDFESTVRKTLNLLDKYLIDAKMRGKKGDKPEKLIEPEESPLGN